MNEKDTLIIGIALQNVGRVLQKVAKAVRSRKNLAETLKTVDVALKVTQRQVKQIKATSFADKFHLEKFISAIETCRKGVRDILAGDIEKGVDRIAKASEDFEKYRRYIEKAPR